MTILDSIPRKWMNTYIFITPIIPDRVGDFVNLKKAGFELDTSFDYFRKYHITEGVVEKLPEKARLDAMTAFVRGMGTEGEILKMALNGKYHVLLKDRLGLEEGDIIGFDAMQGADSAENEIKIEGTNYRYVDYNRVYYVRRGEEVFPMPGHTICKPIPESELSLNGLILIREKKHKLVESEVAFCREEQDIEPGDIIIHDKGAAVPIWIQHKEYARVAYNQILGTRYEQ